MPNEKNLKKYGKDKPVLTHEQAVSYGLLGKKKSDESKARKKMMAEWVKEALEQEFTDKSGKKTEYKGAVANKLVLKMIGGDLKAIELGLKLIGEMPAEKSEITGPNGIPLNPPIINIQPIKVKDE